ncbi:MAG: hypothetical protein HQL72_02115 [Magnetococcales bacterium]|nr:hypothetical protein [Magnetococcales bacterium]
MAASQSGHKFQQAQNVLVKILAAVYVGGAYGLILISMVQIAIVISWFN